MIPINHCVAILVGNFVCYFWFEMLSSSRLGCHNKRPFFFYFFKGKHKYTKRGGPYQTTCGCRGAVSSFPLSNFIFFIFKLYSCCVIPLVNQFHAALSVTSLCYLEKLLREIVCVVPI